MNWRNYGSFSPYKSKRLPGKSLGMAISEFNDANAIQDLIASVVPMKRSASTNGGEYKGPCPACKAGHDRLCVWPDHPRGPQAWCRKCGARGDTLTWAMIIDGYQPIQSGETFRYLKERGYIN